MTHQNQPTLCLAIGVSLSLFYIVCNQLLSDVLNQINITNKRHAIDLEVNRFFVSLYLNCYNNNNIENCLILNDIFHFHLIFRNVTIAWSTFVMAFYGARIATEVDPPKEVPHRNLHDDPHQMGGRNMSNDGVPHTLIINLSLIQFFNF